MDVGAKCLKQFTADHGLSCFTRLCCVAMTGQGWGLWLLWWMDLSLSSLWRKSAPNRMTLEQVWSARRLLSAGRILLALQAGWLLLSCSTQICSQSWGGQIIDLKEHCAVGSRRQRFCATEPGGFKVSHSPEWLMGKAMVLCEGRVRKDVPLFT